MHKFLVAFVCFAGILAVCSGTVEHPRIGRLGKFWQRCQNHTESDGVFMGIYRSVRMGDSCVGRLKFEELWDDLQLITNETRKALFEEYCPQLRVFNICMNTIVDSLIPCFDDIENNITREFVSVLPDAVQLFCKDDGEILSGGGEIAKRLECVREREAKERNCFSILEQFKPIDTFVLTQEQCSIFTNFRQCFKEHVDACEISAVMSLYDLFYNAAFRSGACRNA
ncbi:27 kDa hemolymph glycoprotein-like [Anopheles aquasalis]|uniref:27 kDa hemolymph glycoprotein-like n=1 Tax=Anopheles aquasalis TaxID=42839 RepID=UPI00215ADE5F|nr:27 kDa hemolymph glycoprotein-like [Anopheles aquasalis]